MDPRPGQTWFYIFILFKFGDNVRRIWSYVTKIYILCVLHIYGKSVYLCYGQLSFSLGILFNLTKNKSIQYLFVCKNYPSHSSKWSLLTFVPTDGGDAW